MTLEERREQHKKIMQEISALEAEYFKKFGEIYKFAYPDGKSNEEVIAELKDCIENNHLQVFEPVEYDPDCVY